LLICVSHQSHVQVPLIIVMLFLSAVLQFTLAFTWNMAGSRSWALMSLFLFLSAISTLTSVVYVPHLASYRPQLIAPFFVGMGLGALFPSVVALVQGGRVVTLAFNNAAHRCRQ
jgi:hypothetical protein